MRRILAPSIAILLALALLAAPLALARGGADDGERAGKAKERAAEAKDKAAEARSHARDDAGNKTRDNKTDDAQKEGRRAALDAFMDYFAALRNAWKDNATAIREACHAAEPADNASKEERKSWAHCIRDGYKAFFEAMKLERKALKEEWKAERKAHA